MTSRTPVQDAFPRVVIGQYIQSFFTQGSKLGQFYITRDSTGQIILADAKLDNNMYNRMIIDDPVLLCMFEPDAIAAGLFSLRGGRWPQMQLNCVQHGEARQYIYDALHEISDTLREESDIGETEEELTANPPPRFDLGRLVDLSRFPNGTVLSADEYRQAPYRGRGAVYDSIQQTFFPGSEPAPPRLNLAQPMNRPPLVLLARSSAPTAPPAANGPPQIAGPSSSLRIADVLAQAENGGRVLLNEDIPELVKMNDEKVSLIPTTRRTTPGPAKSDRVAPPPGKFVLQSLKTVGHGPKFVPSAPPVNPRLTQISSTNFELAKLLTDSDSEAEADESFIAELARKAKKDLAASITLETKRTTADGAFPVTIPKAIPSVARLPNLDPVLAIARQSAAATELVPVAENSAVSDSARESQSAYGDSASSTPASNATSGASPAPLHTPGPIRNSTKVRRRTSHTRNKSPNHGLYPQGDRHDAGKALWDNINSIFPDDATRAQYRMYVSTTRLAVAKDSAAKAAFHAELADFVTRMGVVSEHNEYVRFMRTGNNKQFHMPVVE